MSILIKVKGVKPPNGCVWCYFNDDSRCALIVGCDYDNTNGAQRRENCPLIELPDHGDLIDRDALKAECKEPYVWWETETQMARILKDAPVVIPAERSEDD